jgi:two-component system, NarL family, response regulator NreC
MKQKLKILIADDHPIILEGYENALLKEASAEYDITIDSASNCDEGDRKIKFAARKKEPYDLLFLDIKMPASSNGQITSGEDLASVAKTWIPNVKIIVLTTINEAQRIRNILKSINPAGLIIKNDLNSKELIKAFRTVLGNSSYYSQQVSTYLRMNTREDAWVLDDYDRAILYHLSRGVKMKDMTKYVTGLSLGAIEKRKLHKLKKFFGVMDSGDDVLLEKAREAGFI